MVQSKAATVDAYLAEAPAEERARLEAVRETARRALASHQERMHWGMPAYLSDGRVTFGFARQKKYLSLYFTSPTLLDQHAEALGRMRRGKRCLRFSPRESIDWEVLERLLRDSDAPTP
jgi:uncharacterized protein YdhG (YjbR/CyaY superfamily)